jgi:hypothetical protein
MRSLLLGALMVGGCVAGSPEQPASSSSQPTQQPAAAVCSVEIESIRVGIAECDGNDGLRAPCTDAFTTACEAKGGALLTNVENSPFIPMAPECGGGSLFPACTDAFVLACEQRNGSRVCHDEGCERGACKIPTLAALVCGTGYDPSAPKEYTCFCTSTDSCKTMGSLCATTTCEDPNNCTSGTGKGCDDDDD